MTEVNYIASNRKSKFAGYQEKKGIEGTVKVFISTIWNDTNNFESFVEGLIYYTIHERICLERAFNKIRIKGGMCNPCCVENVACEIYKSLEMI